MGRVGFLAWEVPHASGAAKEEGEGMQEWIRWASKGQMSPVLGVEQGWTSEIWEQIQLSPCFLGAHSHTPSCVYCLKLLLHHSDK